MSESNSNTDSNSDDDRERDPIKHQFEALARDGWLEIRARDDDDQWIAMNEPMEVKN